MERGTLIEYQGRPAVRFSRDYGHPAERLWQALTDPDELQHWFPSKVRLEPRAGGAIEFSGDPNLAASTGTVLVHEPPRRLAYSWGGDELHFELGPAGARECVLTFTDVLDARDAAARNAAGWSVCLAELGKLLADGVADGPHASTALSWRELYDSYVAAGMPSGAVIPDPGTG